MQVCPACSVKIAGDTVIFSAGPPGTRARLWARVCQYNKKPGCINQDQDAIGEIQPNDPYIPPEELSMSESAPEPLPSVVKKMIDPPENL